MYSEEEYIPLSALQHYLFCPRQCGLIHLHQVWSENSLTAEVQFSVFECLVDPAQWRALRAELIAIMDKEKDSLRFYFLGSNWEKRLEHIGAKPAINPEAPLIF